MEIINNCPICENTHFDSYLTCKDRVASNEIFDLVKCSNCGFVFTNPRPSEEECGKYYESKNYISHAENKMSFMHLMYQWIRTYSVRRKINWIHTYKTTGNLLDIGCGLGHFLKGIKSHTSFSAVGADISDAAIKHCREQFRLNVIEESELNSIENDSLDVITQWHVLEHVYRLKERMQFLQDKLKKDGVIFIAVPCRESYDADYFKNEWDAYDVPRHIYHFSRSNMLKLFNNYGFKCVSEKGLLFDSTYVSMRSFERNNSKIFSFIMGLFIGIVSNVKASKSGNYSSIVYVFKKI